MLQWGQTKENGKRGGSHLHSIMWMKDVADTKASLRYNDCTMRVLETKNVNMRKQGTIPLMKHNKMNKEQDQLTEREREREREAQNMQVVLFKWQQLSKHTRLQGQLYTQLYTRLQGLIDYVRATTLNLVCPNETL